MKDKKEPLWLKVVFGVIFIFLLTCFVVSWIKKASYRIDSTIQGLFLVWVFWKRKKLGIEPWALVGVMIPVLMNNAGLFGAYNWVLFSLGYDKWLHLVSGFVFTIAIYQILSSRKMSKGFGLFTIAFLMLMGLGAVEELAEFVGSVYGGVGQGFLAQGAGEAFYPVSDLVKYDSLWDMLFNLFGSLLAGILLMFKSR